MEETIQPQKGLGHHSIGYCLVFCHGSFCSLLSFQYVLTCGQGLFGFIDNFAHIGGLMTGILASALILPVETKTPKWQRIKWLIMFLSLGLIVGGIFVGGLVGFYRGTLIGSCKGCKYLSCVPIIGQCDAIWSRFSDY